MRRIPGTVILLALASGLVGCSATRPRNFRAMLHPAPIVRARAAGLNGTEPDSVAVPTLIQRLEDSDPVVRLAAHESLKERTGQDFGYIPWADDQERAPAVARWKSWWGTKRGDAYKLQLDDLGNRRRKR